MKDTETALITVHKVGFKYIVKEKPGSELQKYKTTQIQPKEKDIKQH